MRRGIFYDMVRSEAVCEEAGVRRYAGLGHGRGRGLELGQMWVS